MLDIYVDADACSVKEEIYRVATRYKLKTIVVANQYIHTPMDGNVHMEVVSGGFDAADDWIIENIKEDDLLITSDLLLADRAIKLRARVLGPKGNELDEENIGGVLASRELMAHLRDLGEKNTGPTAMKKKDKSNFLSKMDQIIQSVLKKHR